MKKARSEIIAQLQKQLKTNRHILGVSTGSGLTAKYAEAGGADFILALSSGYFRQKGVSSLAAYLPFSNSNDVVMAFGMKELLPKSIQIPIIFGLFATDPHINLRNYIQWIKKSGFDGINNYPTIGLIDGEFGEALKTEGIVFEREVEAIRIGSEIGLFTVAFVFNQAQAIQMVEAGADVICVHLGLTTGGVLGAKQIKSLQTAKKLATDIFNVCHTLKPSVIKMIYGGPVNKPVDVQFMYDGTDINGYIGGSVFERIPAEYMISSVTQSFKTTSDIKYDALVQKIISGMSTQADYIDFIRKYITAHYQEEISLNELSDIMNLSRSFLSTLFKKEMGISFKDYLIHFRLNRAIEILQEKELPLTLVAQMVGYSEYAPFSKIFKKKIGVSPRAYLHNIKTK
ncbi:putative TIM-barrel enzyme/AraC-like DNA-binding protein [Pullulanibacillus pueri]|uniref:AraC family transcriptional regulator n=1 Tax=Pullulanibacillus pueri TaxID=1437324 RepID=A0A8J3EJP0_9BACL|nr:phosphoenolpyruvate hydrolase family protein [Pullulanibacillus pueri]MBM7679862.1 putative TIM-barrel enzyme/AraC-like DNA-binding protein [Pullulanibacillus pueri]GGH73204.1 AraC family transcriptional regulator [Pullulanibacillus pueri]